MHWIEVPGRAAQASGGRVLFEPLTAAGSGPLKRFLRRGLPAAAAAALIALPAHSSAVAQAPPAPRFVVVLDAAHGGDDAGAMLGSQREKDLTLALSVKLRSLLVARGLAVVTTRESPADVDPERRAEIANHAAAQACLNLHATLSSVKNEPAVHLFLSSLAATPSTRQLLPWRTSQSAWITRSTALAGELNSALTHAGITVTLGRTSLPALDTMACPAVAVEIALEGRGSTEAASSDAGFEAQVADALAAALVEWRADGGQLEASKP